MDFKAMRAATTKARKRKTNGDSTGPAADSPRPFFPTRPAREELIGTVLSAARHASARAVPQAGEGETRTLLPTKVMSPVSIHDNAFT